LFQISGDTSSAHRCRSERLARWSPRTGADRMGHRSHEPLRRIPDLL